MNDSIKKPNLNSDFKYKNIKDCSTEELKELCGELRQKIISAVSLNGGHLSSNLGVVETTVALHRNFDFSKDKLIFDVGHQCYTHKILSDRSETFDKIRLEGGLSGFPDPNESIYDAFVVGHSGTSISAALGICEARDRLGEDYCVIALVGDGSIVNGLNLEALVSSEEKPKNFIVILNDNGMSISKNRNGFYKFISKHTVKKGYVNSKNVIKKVFGDSFVTNLFRRARDFVKRIIFKQNTFERFGFKYIGVVDGNDIKEMDNILKTVHEYSKTKAVFLHVKTQKGKGYKQAEERSDLYHGVGKNCKCDGGVFSMALGEELNSLIEKDNKIVAITAGMKDGTGLKSVEEKHANNFFDVGIAEEYAVTFSAGLAKGGLKPVVAIYSTFLQRAYDQILHDVCIQNLPVVFCLDRSGVVGEDGKTHQGVYDISYLSHIPNIKIFAPSFPSELRETLKYALSLSSPVAIRYPKNGGRERTVLPFDKGLWEKTVEGNGKIVILAVGPRSLDIAEKCAKNNGVTVYSARSVKPIDEKVLLEIKDSKIISIEENAKIGGFGAFVENFYMERKINASVCVLGIEDKFIEHGTVDFQLKENNISTEKILQTINSLSKEVEND